MAKRKSQIEQLRRQVEQAFYRVGQGAQIDIFDLSKIMDAGLIALASGADLDAAVAAAVKQYRKN